MILVGASFPVRELVLRMITLSSNLATNLLVARVSARRTTDFMRALGATDLHVLRGVEDKSAYRLGLNNSATARGFMQILTKLAKREVVSPEDSDEMIAILARQQLNEMIPAQLPSGNSGRPQDRLDGGALSRCGDRLSRRKRRVLARDPHPRLCGK